MSKSIFVTGSGTGVGKTRVSRMLVKEYSELGYRVTYMKPVETGCENSANGEAPVGADTLSVLEFASCRADDLSLHSPYRFVPACSPHLAARLSNCEVSIDHIAATYENLKKATAADIIIVEGAGGLLVPLNDKNQYVGDMIKALGIPAMLVVTPGLGTLNQTFMSLRMLKLYKIPVAGVIINNAQNVERDYIYEDNVATISRHVDPVPCLDIDYCEVPEGNPVSNEPLFSEFYDEVVSRR